MPARSADELAAEVTAAGFQVLQALALPPSPLVLGRGLLLARRPATSDDGARR